LRRRRVPQTALWLIFSTAHFFSENGVRRSTHRGGAPKMRGKRAKVYRLSADHGCSPISVLARNRYARVSVESLELSARLRGRVLRWAAKLDATADPRRPEAWGFADERSAKAFDAEGQRLALALADELKAPVSYLLRGRVRRPRGG
jgi:hypothetical protein